MVYEAGNVMFADRHFWIEALVEWASGGTAAARGLISLGAAPRDRACGSDKICSDTEQQSSGEGYQQHHFTRATLQLHPMSLPRQWAFMAKLELESTLLPTLNLKDTW